MKNVLASLRSGDWRALLACFLYFDTGFTVWVLYGPLAPFIGKSIAMSPSQQGFLVAVPVLAAAILRVTLGNLYQSAPGKRVALLGVALSAIPVVVLPIMGMMGIQASVPVLMVLGVFLGVGGASFAVALPMAGSNYPPRVQGLVLGLAAAGNIGAVLDGFLFPRLANAYGWELAVGGAVPLLAIAALALYFWANDSGAKSGSARRALVGFTVTVVGLIALVLMVSEGVFGTGKTGVLLLPVMGAALAIAVLPKHYRAVLGERDTWVVMLVYSITFGGFVGMSSYVALLLTNLYQLSKIDAGLFMALLAAIGALVRPIGGLIADRVSGVRALTVLLAVICGADMVFALTTPALPAGIAVLIVLYLAFGMGNGATFQLVPHRWAGRTGLLSGIIGAAGGIGGFYLPVIMGIAKESTGSYQMGFATFAALAGLAFVAVVALRRAWLGWSLRAHDAGATPMHATE
ncbi:MFS transporter [Robbsia sp. KACC 23696]|uniref:MFS transporter n=1 Tax=Robbsia sp. KACC 23696 TaxID=3149231 RepID=UPI00325C065A